MSASMTATTFPLSMATPKMKVRVVEVDGADAHVKRLADLGLVKNAVGVIATCGQCGVVVQLDGARLAVDAGMAEGVWVEAA
ncbi:MAG: ferrous iron transport protein A [Planctomycetota bacterium]|nr:ferrous iron transport protein A [Planctomycetota bacterium]